MLNNSYIFLCFAIDCWRVWRAVKPIGRSIAVPSLAIFSLTRFVLFIRPVQFVRQSSDFQQPCRFK